MLQVVNQTEWAGSAPRGQSSLRTKSKQKTIKREILFPINRCQMSTSSIQNILFMGSAPQCILLYLKQFIRFLCSDNEMVKHMSKYF